MARDTSFVGVAGECTALGGLYGARRTLGERAPPRQPQDFSRQGAALGGGVCVVVRPFRAQRGRSGNRSRGSLPALCLA